MVSLRVSLNHRPASARVPTQYYVYLVIFSRDDIKIPNFRHRLPGFPHEDPREIWVKQRQQRDILLSLDPKARWEKHEARKCPLCGCWMLGIQAQMQRERELCARFNNEPLAPCDLFLCKTRSKTL
jgi:hypothetical protein